MHLSRHHGSLTTEPAPGTAISHIIGWLSPGDLLIEEWQLLDRVDIILPLLIRLDIVHHRSSLTIENEVGKFGPRGCTLQLLIVVDWRDVKQRCLLEQG